LTETETPKVPECQRQHGNTFEAFTAGVFAMLVVAMGIWALHRSSVPVQPWCAEFQQYGYHIVPSNNRAAGYVEEFRQKTAYKPEVRLYASPFMQAYGWEDPCDGQEIIVLGMVYINTWSNDELRGLMGHEFGHKLAHRHKNSIDGNSDQGQHEADGYAIELAGEPAVHAYFRRQGWDEHGARERIRDGKKALAALRKRAPLV
jgi:hypothetical protein